MYNNILRVKVFATPGSDVLADDVCKSLQTRLPRQFQPDNLITRSHAEFSKFSNDNYEVQVEEVRGCFVVVVHTQVFPVNTNLVLLFALLDAIKNAQPADTLLVFGYMPYSRSDRKNKPRISVLGSLIPRIINDVLGIKRIILLDPHDSHIKHYFNPSADEITAMYLFADYIESQIFSELLPKEKFVIVFSDAGAAKRYEQIPKMLNMPYAYIDKNRNDNSEKPHVINVIGCVAKKYCIVFDDEILTGNTSINDVEALISAGAEKVLFFATHGVFADQNLTNKELMDKLVNSPIEQFIITTSIPSEYQNSKFVYLSIAHLIAEAIKLTVQNESLTVLHNKDSVSSYRPY